jgi:hypothetical protein
MNFKLFGLRISFISILLVVCYSLAMYVLWEPLVYGTQTQLFSGPDITVPGQMGVVMVISPAAPFTIQMRTDSSFGTIRKEVGTPNDTTYRFSETLSYGDPWVTQAVKHYSQPVQFPSGGTTFYTYADQEFRILGDAQLRVKSTGHVRDGLLWSLRLLFMFMLVGCILLIWYEHIYMGRVRHHRD